MFEMKSKIASKKPKFVMLLPCLVLLAACSSKQIENAANQPIDEVPAEISAEANTFSNATPEPESYMAASSDDTLSAAATGTTTATKSKRASKKSKLAAHKSMKKKTRLAKKKSKAITTAASGTVRSSSSPSVNESNSNMPEIGEQSLQNAAIEMPPIAPPIPLDPTIEAPPQPNWVLASLTIAGIIGLIGVIFRIRRSTNRKRGLVFN